VTANEFFERFPLPFKLLLALVLVALSPVIIAVLVGWLLWLTLLHLAVLMLWLPRGRNLLFVYSDSPNWKAYIEGHVLPRLPESTVVLNWSHRSRWRRWTLPALLFCAHAGQRDFNPIAIIFRPFRRARKFRFWRAFRDYKHGNVDALRKVEDALFRELSET
jgi:hypothetical protein